MIHETKDTKIIGGAGKFFEANNQLKEVFVSEDGQYFFTVSASNFHCKQHGHKLFRVTRAQATKPEAKQASEPARPELKTEAVPVPPPKNKGGRPPRKPAGEQGETTKKQE